MFSRQVDVVVTALSWRRTVVVEQGRWRSRRTAWKPAHGENVRNLRAVQKLEPDIEIEAGMRRAGVGEPPLSYLTSWRMTNARRLLQDSDAPLATVAARSGYGSEFAFAKAFKRAYGIAPGSYRRRSRRQRPGEPSSLHWALR